MAVTTAAPPAAPALHGDRLRQPMRAGSRGMTETDLAGPPGRPRPGGPPRTRTSPPGAADRVRAVDRGALAAAYQQGDSLRGCGKRFGISPPAAARLLRQHGVTIRPRRPYKARADAAALAASYTAGHTLAECGQQHGISAPTVARILRENGVTIRPAHRRPGTSTRVVLAHCRRHGPRSPAAARHRARGCQRRDAATAGAQAAVLAVPGTAARPRRTRGTGSRERERGSGLGRAAGRQRELGVRPAAATPPGPVP